MALMTALVAMAAGGEARAQGQGQAQTQTQTSEAATRVNGLIVRLRTMADAPPATTTTAVASPVTVAPPATTVTTSSAAARPRLAAPVLSPGRSSSAPPAVVSEAGAQAKYFWWWPWWPADRPKPIDPVAPADGGDGDGGSNGDGGGNGDGGANQGGSDGAADGEGGSNGADADGTGTGTGADDGSSSDPDPGSHSEAGEGSGASGNGNDAENGGSGAVDGDGSGTGTTTTDGNGNGNGNGNGTTTPSTPPDTVTPTLPVAPPVVVDLDPATGLVADPVAATAAVSSRSGVAVAFSRHAADGSLVMALASPLSPALARDVAQRLMADPAVLSATPDYYVRSTEVNDPLYSQQWSIRPLGKFNVGSANVAPLWSVTRGLSADHSAVVVAVLDSGRTHHPELNAAWLGGYDFVSASPDGSLTVTNDGDGRDADPSDPGNACPDGAAGPTPSNWHGTAVAGIIAAMADNQQGIAGAAPLARIVPVRVLGRCGGRLSDTLDAMQWAAGLSVPGVPDNPNPARVINLSLAADGGEPCTSDTSSLVQDVVDRVLASNVLVVAAAGNDGALTSYPQDTGAIGLPGNCRGVLTVAAHTRSGDLAGYSSFGARVGLTAPGGAGGGSIGCKQQSMAECQIDSILTTGNTGGDAPADASYNHSFIGTSAAAPHVSAVAALLFSIRPSASPQDVITAMTSTARPWPESSFCHGSAGQGLCGSGMLDAQAAAMHLMTAPLVSVDAVNGPLAGGSVLTLRASGSSAHYDASTLSWHWRQVSGGRAVLTAGPGPQATLTLPATRSQVVIEVSATDPAGLSTFVNIVLEVNNRPEPPQVATQYLTSGVALRLSLAGRDADGDAIRYALLRGPSDLLVDATTGLLRWPSPVVGSHEVAVALTDAWGARGPDLVFQIVVEAPAASQAAELAPPTAAKGGGGASGLLEAALFALLAGAANWRRRGQAAAPGGTR